MADDSIGVYLEVQESINSPEVPVPRGSDQEVPVRFRELDLVQLQLICGYNYLPEGQIPIFVPEPPVTPTQDFSDTVP